jgi:predicted acyl esterase
VPPGEPVEYRIPLVPNARRFAARHRIRLILTSDDQPKDTPAIMGFRHTPAGTAAHNVVHSASRLLLPVLTRSSESAGDGVGGGAPHGREAGTA